MQRNKHLKTIESLPSAAKQTLARRHKAEAEADDVA
jgi:hypothetical protein